ncbi:MAG: chemotaxis protein CheC [candidate division WOR-3 bacterium]
MMRDDLLDGLREVINIGAGHGASALSLLLGKKVSLAVPRVWHGALQEALEAFDGDKTPVFGFTFRIMGDMEGWVLVTVSEKDGQSILRMLWPGESSLTSEEMLISGLGETAHIVSGAFLSAMANMMDMVAFQSIPRMKRGPHSDVIADFIGRIGEYDSIFIGIEIEMTVESLSRWEMIFVPKAASVGLVAEKLEDMLR